MAETRLRAIVEVQDEMGEKLRRLRRELSALRRASDKKFDIGTREGVVLLAEQAKRTDALTTALGRLDKRTGGVVTGLSRIAIGAGAAINIFNQLPATMESARTAMKLWQDTAARRKELGSFGAGIKAFMGGRGGGWAGGTGPEAIKRVTTGLHKAASATTAFQRRTTEAMKSSVRLGDAATGTGRAVSKLGQLFSSAGSAASGMARKVVQAGKSMLPSLPSVPELGPSRHGVRHAGASADFRARVSARLAESTKKVAAATAQATAATKKATAATKELGSAHGKLITTKDRSAKVSGKVIKVRKSASAVSESAIRMEQRMMHVGEKWLKQQMRRGTADRDILKRTKEGTDWFTRKGRVMRRLSDGTVRYVRSTERAAKSERASASATQFASRVRSKFTEGLRRSLTPFKSVGRAAGGLRSALSGAIGKLGGFTLGLGAAVLAVGALVVGLGKLAIGGIAFVGKMQKMQIQFENLTGSADAAKQHLKGLASFAASTPFQLEGIAAASRHLLTFGGQSLASAENLRLFGDAAAGTSQPIEDVSMWVGRMYSSLQAGRPIGEATSRLQEMGVLGGPARVMLEEMAESGASARDVMKAFKDEIGRFDGSMKKMSGTIPGLHSTFADLTLQVGGALAEALQLDHIWAGVVWTANLLLTGVLKLLQGFNWLTETIAGGVVGGFKAAVGWFGKALKPLAGVTLHASEAKKSVLQLGESVNATANAAAFKLGDFEEAIKGLKERAEDLRKHNQRVSDERLDRIEEERQAYLEAYEDQLAAQREYVREQRGLQAAKFDQLQALIDRTTQSATEYARAGMAEYLDQQAVAAASAARAQQILDDAIQDAHAAFGPTTAEIERQKEAHEENTRAGEDWGGRLMGLAGSIGGAFKDVVSAVSNVGRALAKGDWVGAAIAGVTAVWGKIKSIGGPSEAEKAGRQSAQDWLSGLRSGLSNQQLKEAVDSGWGDVDLAASWIGMRDAALEAGLSIDEAKRYWDRMQAAIKEGPEAVQRVRLEFDGLVADSAAATAEQAAFWDGIYRSAVSAFERAREAGRSAYRDAEQAHRDYAAAAAAGDTRLMDEIVRNNGDWVKSKEAATAHAIAVEAQARAETLRAEGEKYARMAAFEAALDAIRSGNAEGAAEAARQAALDTALAWETAIGAVEEADDAAAAAIKGNAKAVADAQIKQAERARKGINDEVSRINDRTVKIRYERSGSPHAPGGEGIPEAHGGGVFSGPRSGYLVRLHKTETVVPGAHPGLLSGRGGSGAPTIIINVDGADVLDARRFGEIAAEAMADGIRRVSGVRV